MIFPLRELGRTGIFVTPLAMGGWPITGITSIGVTEEQSLATIRAAADSGLNFFDTAYCYGFNGESEKMMGAALRHCRDNIVIASKGGIHYENGVQFKDARPETLIRQCEESLQRLGTDRIDLYYLHAPDPNTPLRDSAIAMSKLLAAGKIRSIGVSNFTLDQLLEFHSVCPISAYQPHYNMLQREIELSQLPWCVDNHVSAVVYWPLMKGLLAGKLDRDYKFHATDGRQKYPMFAGEEFAKNQDFLDQLRPIAAECQTTGAQVVLTWTLQRPGITVGLCGAKRPDQIQDNAASLNWKLTAAQIERIDQAIRERGPIVSKAAV